MIWIAVLAIVTYLASLKNGMISDDITVFGNMQRENYKITKRLFISNFNEVMNRLLWRLFKDRPLLHHIFNIVVYTAFCCVFYSTLCKFIPEPVAFISALVFVVHPCNAQICGWISGRWYAVGGIVALIALNTNNIFLYWVSSLSAQGMFLLPLIMKVPIWQKLLAMYIYIIFMNKVIEGKEALSNSEIAFKNENMRVYPRKLIVALKSFCYYFTLAVIPLKLGWFHELGEPIDKKVKQMNFHFALCVLLLITLALFIPHKASLGLLIFCLGIAPYVNIITPALFTAERYMTAALMGYSIFVGYLTYQYPIVAAVLITYYFTRTQFELWAYRDDLRLALNSLINFDRSGYAWNNVIRYLFKTEEPFLAYGMAKQAEKLVPDFPSTYHHLFMIHNCADLPFFNPTVAMNYLEKACLTGRHDGWWRELAQYKEALKKHRVERFKQNVARDSTTRCIQPPIKQPAETNRQECVGVTP